MNTTKGYSGVIPTDLLDLPGRTTWEFVDLEHGWDCVLSHVDLSGREFAEGFFMEINPMLRLADGYFEGAAEKIRAQIKKNAVIQK